MFGKTTPGRRRRVTIPLPKDLLASARELGIDVSQAVEAGVAKAVSDKRDEVWVSENAEAIASSNAYVDRMDQARGEGERVGVRRNPQSCPHVHETRAEADEASSMRVERPHSVSLPDDVMALIKARMRLGGYVSESDVIREGLQLLLARDHAVETWFQDQVGRAYDALKAERAFSITIQAMCKHLAAEIESVFREG
jgi:antitoxin ParD1/3/4